MKENLHLLPLLERPMAQGDKRRILSILERTVPYMSAQEYAIYQEARERFGDISRKGVASFLDTHGLNE